jgi:hypothetical protein
VREREDVGVSAAKREEGGRKKDTELQQNRGGERERGEWHLMPLIEGRGKILEIFFVETQAALDVLHLTSFLICRFAKQS